MDSNTTFTIKPIGWVESSYDGASAANVVATIELFPAYAEGAVDIKAGDRLMVLFYFDRASEELLTVPLMGNGPLVGAFSSHAPMRPLSLLSNSQQGDYARKTNGRVA